MFLALVIVQLLPSAASLFPFITLIVLIVPCLVIRPRMRDWAGSPFIAVM